MDRISIIGGKHLNGSLPISGAKNAALPLMMLMRSMRYARPLRYG